MPIVSFSNEDLLRSRIILPGWYVVAINSIGEKPSNDGGSTNYPVEGIVGVNADNGDGSFAGVPLYWMFNSKAKGFMVGFVKVLVGTDPKADERFELKMAEGKSLEVFIENGEYQGRIKNNVNHKYRVLGAGK